MSEPPAGASPALARFLAEEVRDPFYADLLLELAEAAGRGKSAPGASGNAYYVSFGPREVVIEHHYLADWLPLRIARDDFLLALRAWRAKTR
jgi:hypothetical protein